jgi:hypothetical protein
MTAQVARTIVAIKRAARTISRFIIVGSSIYLPIANLPGNPERE